MTHGSHYLGKLYNDLIANSPQTISMDIPSDMGKGRIAQTQIKHGIIFSDWQMCYQSDMNVQGTVSKDYMQIIFCLNDGISWGIMDEKRSITIQKNESCIYAGHGGTEYACYKKDSNFSFKSIKIPIAYFSQLLTDYFDGQEATAYEKKLLDGISKVPVTPIMEQILAETSQFTQYRGGLGYLYLDGKLLELLSIYLGEVLELNALELSDYRERHPASLSGGQKQRVTIGVAIVKDSLVIYFDEPTSGLDYDSMVRVSKLIEQLSDSGVIVFVVSHDFEFIVRTCTEVVQLDDDGTIQNQQLSPTVLKSLSEKYFT